MLLHWFPLFRVLVHCVYNRLAPPAEAYEERQILQEKRIFYGQRVETSGKVHICIHTHIHTERTHTVQTERKMIT